MYFSHTSTPISAHKLSFRSRVMSLPRGQVLLDIQQEAEVAQVADTITSIAQPRSLAQQVIPSACQAPASSSVPSPHVSAPDRRTPWSRAREGAVPLASSAAPNGRALTAGARRLLPTAGAILGAAHPSLRWCFVQL